MIAVGHKLILQVKVLHSYFYQNKCNCLTFNPTDSTLKLMQRFGFKLINNVDGINFYVKTKDSLKNYLSYIKAVTNINSFDFNITTRDSDFNIITELPVDWFGTINFDSKNKTNTVSKGVLSIQPDYLATKASNNLAQMTIKFDDILKYKVQDLAMNVEINFKARSTQWQYYVINRSSIKLDNPKITGQTDINFYGPMKTIIETGQEALLFTSGKQLIPLSESIKYKFDLVNDSSPEDNSLKNKRPYRLLFSGLPNPTPSGIGFKIDAITKVVASPMYVYV